MAAPDYPNSDDIPDLSLPERTEKRSESYPLRVNPVSSTWREGDRVLAPKEPNFLFVGRIVQLQHDQASIVFEDGSSAQVPVERLRKMALRQGQSVYCRRGSQYVLGEILTVRDDDVCVTFDNGRREEWAELAALRIPSDEGSAPLIPTRGREPLVATERYQPGDRVWAPWNRGVLFVGTVEEIREGEAHVHFDDGDRGWVMLAQLSPLQLVEGLRIMGRWKMGPHCFPGTIKEVRDERIYIIYDDGDKEWTTPAALLMACQPMGPDARPTKVASHSTWPTWLWPTILGVVILFLRIGCR